MKVERREVIAAIHKQRGEFMTADVAATLGVHSRRAHRSRRPRRRVGV
jgi:hypothetical protein